MHFRNFDILVSSASVACALGGYASAGLLPCCPLQQHGWQRMATPAQRGTLHHLHRQGALIHLHLTIMLPNSYAGQQVAEEHYNGRPIPLFGYNRKDGFLDLMFPDFTYFVHEYSQITGATG